MFLRPILLIAVLMAAPFAATAQSAVCDPTTTTCPDLTTTGVNVDP